MQAPQNPPPKQHILREHFWQRYALDQLTSAEWEALCDGCARCCVEKWEDEDTGEIAYTNEACELLNCQTCQCTDYANRQQRVPECLPITPAFLTDQRKRGWLPDTCAYRLVAEGRELYAWHPLISGRQASVAEAGITPFDSAG